MGLPRPALAAGAVRCRKMIPEYVKEIRPPHAKPHDAPRHAGGSNGSILLRINGVRPGTGDAHQTSAIPSLNSFSPSLEVRSCDVSIRIPWMLPDLPELRRPVPPHAPHAREPSEAYHAKPKPEGIMFSADTMPAGSCTLPPFQINSQERLQPL